MAEVHDWQCVDDPQAVVRRAVQALRGGRAVVFPTPATYVLAATAPTAFARAVTLPPALGVRGEDEALLWAPNLGIVGRRLARRCWPGPVVLAVDVEPARLPEGVRSQVYGDEGLRLWMPDHEALLASLFQLEEPLLLAPISEAPQQLAADNLIEMVVTDGEPSGQPPTLVRLEGATWSVLRPGAVAETDLTRYTNCVIVFVCTGNTCRSPLAEALCKKLLADRLDCTPDELPARGLSVLSAGLAAMMGGGAAEEAVAVAHSYGGDLTGHRSQPLSVELAAQADYLLGMTRGHVQMMSEYYPRLGAEPRLLHPEGADIPDPVGCPREVYEQCAREIRQALEVLLADLEK